MAFGIYVHIPYCLQRCPYCDFATYEYQQIRPPKEYIEMVKKEIRMRSKYIPHREMQTIYFGGGTPSLIEAELIAEIISELEDNGFQNAKDIEITLEINPATIDLKKMDTYRKSGINRFSVGAQTFDENLLKKIGRKHNRQDTLDTLKFLRDEKVDYTFDVLFALPDQSLDQLKLDVETALTFEPSHLSAYILTLPENHKLQEGRALEPEQIEMSDYLVRRFAESGLEQYEISNFAKPGKESKHNMLYWTDENYWGIGMSSHSYLNDPDWGERFWNSNTIESYEKQLQSEEFLPARNREKLEKHQSLTDFCHIFLRLEKGLPLDRLEGKFGSGTAAKVTQRLSQIPNEWLLKTENSYSLTPLGRQLSNQVFAELTFLENEI